MRDRRARAIELEVLLCGGKYDTPEQRQQRIARANEMERELRAERDDHDWQPHPDWAHRVAVAERDQKIAVAGMAATGALGAFSLVAASGLGLLGFGVGTLSVVVFAFVSVGFAVGAVLRSVAWLRLVRERSDSQRAASRDARPAEIERSIADLERDIYGEEQ